MDERNPHGLALGFRRARGKTLKIKELGITPDMSEDDVNDLIKTLAQTKAKAESEDGSIERWKEYVKGQAWYVEDLKRFSALGAKERLEMEYAQAFPDVASEQEMLSELQDLVA